MVLFSSEFHTFLLYSPIVHHSRNQWPGTKLISALFSLVIKPVIPSQHPKYFGWFSMGPAIFATHIWLLPHDEAALRATPYFSTPIGRCCTCQVALCWTSTFVWSSQTLGKVKLGLCQSNDNFSFAVMSFVLLTWAVINPALCTQDTSDPSQVPLQCFLAEISDSSCNSQAPLNLAPVKTIFHCLPVSNKYSTASYLKTQNRWNETKQVWLMGPLVLPFPLKRLMSKGSYGVN